MNKIIGTWRAQGLWLALRTSKMGRNDCALFTLGARGSTTPTESCHFGSLIPETSTNNSSVQFNFDVVVCGCYVLFDVFESFLRHVDVSTLRRSDFPPFAVLFNQLLAFSSDFSTFRVLLHFWTFVAFKVLFFLL